MVIVCAMPNNSTLTNTDIVDDGTITGSSSQGSNSLVHCRSSLANRSSRDSGEMTNGLYNNKCVRTNINS